jgi:hypothetical protein
MVSENNGPTTRRIAAGGDVEVSTYLEIAEVERRAATHS